ncbi:MAG: hypothetical protein LBU36_06870 [Clostridiales bacterium]|jgi:hypothetical protein|nr:hypothetical protein [Clostridiales bacterium]
MKRGFTSGLIAGGAMAALALSWALSDRRVRDRVKRDTQKMMDKIDLL